MSARLWHCPPGSGDYHPVENRDRVYFRYSNTFAPHPSRHREKPLVSADDEAEDSAVDSAVDSADAVSRKQPGTDQKA